MQSLLVTSDVINVLTIHKSVHITYFNFIFLETCVKPKNLYFPIDTKEKQAKIKSRMEKYFLVFSLQNISCLGQNHLKKQTTTYKTIPKVGLFHVYKYLFLCILDSTTYVGMINILGKTFHERLRSKNIFTKSRS